VEVAHPVQLEEELVVMEAILYFQVLLQLVEVVAVVIAIK
jgi:hypothetical protein